MPVPGVGLRMSAFDGVTVTNGASGACAIRCSLWLGAQTVTTTADHRPLADTRRSVPTVSSSKDGSPLLQGTRYPPSPPLPATGARFP